MRYSHDSMLPSRAFNKLGKHLSTFEGGDDEAEYIPMKPANVTTGFGTALADPERGIYNYQLDPRLAAMRDVFYGAANQFLPTQEQQMFAQQVGQQGQDVYGRGTEFLNQALGMNPQQVGQQYYRDVQALMAEDRAAEEARLADTLFKTGRSGAAVGYGGGYLNPEQFALLKAREQANQRLAIDAETLGRQRQAGDVQFAQGVQGLGLQNYSAGQGLRMQPYQQAQTLFGVGTGIEQLGFQPLNVGLQALPLHAQIQAGKQAVEDANASGGKGGGLLGGIANAGMNYFMSGGNPLAAGAGFIGGMSGSSPSSGFSGLLGNLGIDNGWGNLTGTSYSPYSTIQNTPVMGIGGYTPSTQNWGGGTFGPSW